MSLSGFGPATSPTTNSMDMMAKKTMDSRRGQDRPTALFHAIHSHRQGRQNYLGYPGGHVTPVAKAVARRVHEDGGLRQAEVQIVQDFDGQRLRAGRSLPTA